MQKMFCKLVAVCVITIVVSVSSQDCTTVITVGPSIEGPCDLSGALKTVCQDLQSALKLAASEYNQSSCIEVDVAPGIYAITEEVVFARSVVLQGSGPDVQVTFTTPPSYNSTSITPLYILSFLNVENVWLKGINFSNSTGLIQFVNVTTVLIMDSTFRYFVQGAVDVYNCAHVIVTNCMFEYNGPADVLKPQQFRGHAGGLSICYYDTRPSFITFTVVVKSCTFTGNTAQSSIRTTQTTSQVFVQNLFPARGGALALIAYTFNPLRVLIEDCSFIKNFASSAGGAVFTVTDGASNSTIVVIRSRFLNNTCSSLSGGLFIGYREQGSFSRLRSVYVQDSEFTGNVSPYGGGANFIVPGRLIVNREIGNYAFFGNCTFIANEATLYGAAILVTSSLLFENRQNVKPVDIVNCTFIGNKGEHGVGTVSTSYYSVNFGQINLFKANRGPTLRADGSVISVMDDSVLQFASNIDAESGGALLLTSFAQVVLSSNSKMLFENNVGRYGAAIVSDSPILPTVFAKLQYNPLCFLLTEDIQTSPLLWNSRKNISLSFTGNVASIASSMLIRNIEKCSWTQLKEPFFNVSGVFRWSAFNYSGNTNYDHLSDQNNTLWDVQTPALGLTVASKSVTAYPGQKSALDIVATDELGFPVSAIVGLSQGINEDTVAFSPSVHIVRAGLDSINISYLISKPVFSEIITVQGIFDTTPPKDTFQITSLDCPPGFILDVTTKYKQCKCNLENAYIVNCNQSGITYRDGLWGNVSHDGSRYGDTLANYPCPNGYCRCQRDGDGNCVYLLNFQNSDLQCSCNRQGPLCGTCKNQTGVSVLLNKCVSCKNSQGVLIAGLVLADAVIFCLFLALVKFTPMWLYPCIFYIQILPFITEHFPVTFGIVHHYLYYISSGLSFYFVYDFCLYSNMSPLVSYFIRYLPLFTALIAMAVIVPIKLRKSHHIGWHGLWWIIVLMFTHVVHTSLSILNCPRLPGENGNVSYVWFVAGATECFSGFHLALTFLAVLILLICAVMVVALFLITTKLIKVHIKFGWIQNLIANLSEDFKDSYKWWSAVDLSRRLVLLIIITATPGNNQAVSFVILASVTLYGFFQPYKLLVTTVLEVVIGTTTVAMLVLKNTETITSSLQTVPQHPSSNKTCVDNDDLEELTGLVVLLTPFYYFPLISVLLGVLAWVISQVKHKWFVNGGSADAEAIDISPSINKEVSTTTVELSLNINTN